MSAPRRPPRAGRPAPAAPRRPPRAGRPALIGAVLLWGVSLTGFGLTSLLPLALVLLALAGLGDLISETLRPALLQHGTPDGLRGRVSSLWRRSRWRRRSRRPVTEVMEGPPRVMSSRGSFVIPSGR
ncbi:hypothetical protein OG501_27165 [Streptomyces niveus]|uniref:hypothetical protein n=1 Tax=Streptomyces niveus TaxID=193462 RepID=UPI003864EDD3